MNARLLLPGRWDGIGNFTRETLSRITCGHREHEFLFLFDRPFSQEFLYADNIRPVVLSPPTRHAALLTYFLEKSVPRALAGLKPDLFLAPDGWLSLRLPTPAVSVIHDLNFEVEKSFQPWHLRPFYTHLFPRYARKAARVATVSQFSKRELQARYGVPEGKIDVVSNGVGAHFRPLAADTIKQVRGRISDGRSYFLIIGGLCPRKNVANQIRAFQRLCSSGAGDLRLVIVGETRWAGREARQLIRKLGRDTVKVLGRVDNQEMALVTGSATALCCVSFYEGFGLPSVEAMRAGVPVIASDRTAMPEVCGEAALLIDPHSVEGIQGAMGRIVRDNTLRRSLIERGLLQSRRYEWDRTAQRLWESIERAIEPGQTSVG